MRRGARQFCHECGKSAWPRCEDDLNSPRQQTSRDAPSGLLAEVRLLNDDHTPMEFVVHVLEWVFGMDRETATRTMFEIHNEGFGTCGIYPYDIADAKASFREQAVIFRRAHNWIMCFLYVGTFGKGAGERL